MEPRVLGPAVSPGQLFYEKCQQRASTSTHGTSFPALAPANPSPLLQTIRSAFPPDELRNDSSSKINHPQRRLGTMPSSSKIPPAFEARTPNIDEELFWFDFTLVWSRGSTVFRTYTYAHEGQRIKHAMFAWFRETPVPSGSTNENDQQGSAEHDVSRSSTVRSKRPVKKPPTRTFGPWATSYTASWSSRTTANISNNEPCRGSESNPLERCLVVFLENIARVYFPSGEDKILPIPFELDNAWPLPGGGLMLQRAATRKEKEGFSKGKGRAFPTMADQTISNMDRTMDLMLEELDNNAVGMDLGLQPVSNQARVYTVTHPTSEMMFLSQTKDLTGGFVDAKGRHRRAARPSQLRPMAQSMEVIFVSDVPEIPIYVCYDHSSNDIVFYRWARLSDQQQISSPIDETIAPTREAASADMQGVVEANGKPSNRQKRVSIAPEAISYSRRPRVSNAEATSDMPRRRPSLKRERSNTITANNVDSAVPQSGVEIVRAALNENGNLLDSKEPTARARAEGDVIRGVSRKVERRWSAQANSRPNGRAKVLQDMTEADLRETTMLMGLEKVERNILSDVVGEQIHRWGLPDKL
jgi:anaphase-promoting complex subunit 1